SGAQKAARNCQQQTLHRCLAKKLDPVCSQRAPNRVFLSSLQSASQQEPAHISTSNQENECHCAKERQKQPAAFTIQLLGDRFHFGGESFQVTLGLSLPRSDRA